MNLRRIGATLAVALLLAAIGAGSARAQSRPTPLRVLALEGESLTISLRANPSTGYRWTLQPLKPNAIVTIDKGAYQASSVGVPGAPGWMVYHATATDVGLTPLTFTYARPFEKNVPPARTFTVVVRCDPRTSAADTSTQVFYCQPDDRFEVTLPSSRDGFTWNMVDKSYDGGVLLSLGRTLAPAVPASAGRPAVPAQTIHRFKAVGVGSTKALLMYQKPGVENAAINTTAVRVEK